MKFKVKGIRIRFNGKDYLPGETIELDSPDESLKRFLGPYEAAESKKDSKESNLPKKESEK